MSEIEKMYKNAGLSNMWVEEYDDKQFWHGCYNEMIQSMMKLNDWDRKTAISVAHKECRKAHPPFTAEKQLELIKWLAKTGDVCRIDATVKNKWFVENEVGYSKCFAKFAEALANVINIIWGNLSDTGKEQIREILNANI